MKPKTIFGIIIVFQCIYIESVFGLESDSIEAKLLCHYDFTSATSCECVLTDNIKITKLTFNEDVDPTKARIEMPLDKNSTCKSKEMIKSAIKQEFKFTTLTTTETEPVPKEFDLHFDNPDKPNKVILQFDGSDCSLVDIVLHDNKMNTLSLLNHDIKR